jgi:thiazole synthase
MMWKVGAQCFESRLLLGTSRFPSPQVMQEALVSSGTEIVTVALRRQSPHERGGETFWELITRLKLTVLPNTAGCRSAKEAVSTAHLARELFNTRWIKLEVIGDEQNLVPDPFGLLEAARILSGEDFEIFPYTTDDIVVAERLLHAGCRVLMPWGSPIGSGQGLANPSALKNLRARFPEVPLILDAGIGRPSHAAQAMELGYDACLLNTAIATADDPVRMAKSFSLAAQAGRLAFEAGVMSPRATAVPSTPVLGTPFWNEVPS